MNKIDIGARIERYREFYRGAAGPLMVVAYLPEIEAQYTVDLTQFDFTDLREHRRYWDILIQNQWDIIDLHARIDDNYIPGIDLFYGFGSFGAVYCDSKVIFTSDTSYMKPVIHDWSEELPVLNSKDRFWSEVFVGASRYLSKKGGRSFMVNAYPNPSPLDVVNLLRGNELFTDFFDYPEKLKSLLSETVPAIVENARRIRNALTNPWGGSFIFNKWIPEGLLILEDAADLCSPAIYEEFGKPYTQEVIRRMGGAYLHHHSLGAHQFANMASLEGLYVQQISSDPNCARPIRDFGSLMEKTSGRTVDLECTPDEVYENIDSLLKGKCFLWVECSTVEEAQNVTEFVKQATHS